MPYEIGVGKRNELYAIFLLAGQPNGGDDAGDDFGNGPGQRHEG